MTIDTDTPDTPALDTGAWHLALEEVMELQLALVGPGITGHRSAPTPCPAFTVEQLLDHVLWAQWFLIGATGSGAPADDAPAGDTELGRRFATIGSAAVEGWAARGTEGSVRLGPHELPAPVGLGSQVLETYLHSWDLARATGRPFEPTPGVTATTTAIARSILTDDLRGPGPEHPFGPELAPGPDAAPVDALVALAGRDPRWSPRAGIPAG